MREHDGHGPDRAATDDLAAVWGPAAPTDRPPRLLGVFAHPDDEVFCVGGTMARCVAAGAHGAILSLTQGEGGQIRDAATATRRTLGAVRAAELERAVAALGVSSLTCLDLGDGHLPEHPLEDLAATVRACVEGFRPDVVVTFGPDGAFGHPDHVTSCLAALEALRALPDPPRLLHARFPEQRQLLVDLIVGWLTSEDRRFSGTAAFSHALKLFADGSSMLGFAADHLSVEWFPAGSFIIEQGEPASQLYCILSGSVRVAVEREDGRLEDRSTLRAGSFVGEDGLATGRPRNAHVIAVEDVTCLVLAPRQPSRSMGRGATATSDPAASGPAAAPGPTGPDGVEGFAVDVRPSLDRKVAALAAHRSQYALDADLLPRSILEPLLGTEHFAVVDVGA